MSTTDARLALCQRGFSLIELLFFIIVVGVAVSGVVSVYSSVARHSADPMIRKQAVTVAESLLEEVLSQPFTYCDPNDPNAETAADATGCTLPEAMGAEAGEVRGSNTDPFDNVNDYNGLAMVGITDITGAPVPGLANYSAAILVEQPAADFNGIPAAEVLMVTVSVTGPDNETVRLSGYRTRYAPNF